MYQQTQGFTITRDHTKELSPKVGHIQRFYLDDHVFFTLIPKWEGGFSVLSA